MKNQTLITTQKSGATGSGGNYNTNTNEEERQVDSGEINYHVVSIVPTNSDFLKPTTSLSRELKQKKFVFSGTEQTKNMLHDF